VLPSFHFMDVLSTLTSIEEGKRGPQNRFHVRPLPPPLRVEELYALLTQTKICKDMLTKCPAVAVVCSDVRSGPGADVPASVLRDPAHVVTPSDRPHCKNACTSVHEEGKKGRSNRADHRAGPGNQHSQVLRAGPRTANSRQLTRFAARVVVADSAGSAPAAAHARDRWPDNVGSPATAATVVPPGDTLHCNNVLADAAARKAVRIL
jgi:hypothetical protein